MRLRNALGLAGALLLLPDCGNSAPPRVLLIGDSITEGIVSGAPGPPYATSLATLLAGEFAVENAGVSGASVVHWEPEAAAFAGRHLFAEVGRPRLPADIVVVLLGTNGAVGLTTGGPVSPSSFRKSLLRLLAGLEEGGAGSLLLVAPPSTAHIRGISRHSDRLLQLYGDAIRRLCSERPELTCGPDLFTLLDPERDFAPGDLHPNAAGHARIARALAAAIRGLAEASTPDARRGSGRDGLAEREGFEPSMGF